MTALLTDRERFVAQVFTAPLLKADAVVVLCGEDATARLATGCELINARCASKLVLSGGLHAPPRVQNAASLAPHALGMGIAPEAVIVEDGSQHTRDQATNVVAIAHANSWKRLLIVASAYHAPRALLTFIQAASRAGMGDRLHMLMVPSAGHWNAHIPDTRATRLDRYDTEMKKLLAYQRTGDCASFAVGLCYLTLTEGK